MKIYQVWDGSDMANSDSFFPTLILTIQHMRDCYGIKGPIKLDEKGEWEGVAEDHTAKGFDVHIDRHEIDLTREGLCQALRFIPNR